MRFANREEVEELRRTYPAGCRIVLDQMEDVQAPPVGTQGTVMGVDDSGAVMPVWDTGGSLHIIFGVDRCHKIATEDEARATMNFYGRKQPEKDARCPRCGSMMFGKTHAHAMSRRAYIVICDRCGIDEALEDVGMKERLPLTKWAAAVIPQVGGGAWKR